MVKIQFKEQKRSWSVKTRELFQKITEIIDDYQEQDYTLTLRQLYYQLVSRDLIPNEIKEYAKLSKLITNARYFGLIDWDAIVDRTREVSKHSEFDGLSHLMKAASQSYRKDRHKEQRNYVEVWVEKDALAGVLEPITNKYHLNLMVNRGYSSSTAMFKASMRCAEQSENNSKNSIILYLGDHDPSGIDMVRDIEDRMNNFGVGSNDMHPLFVKRIALTQAQINEYKPTPKSSEINRS